MDITKAESTKEIDEIVEDMDSTANIIKRDPTLVVGYVVSKEDWLLLQRIHAMESAKTCKYYRLGPCGHCGKYPNCTEE